jgi:hypothetical protein
MSKILLTLAAAFMPVLASMSWFSCAKAADMDVLRANRHHIVTTNPYCRALWRCGPAGCDWYRVCSRPCPDRYSCSALYGAYGPYGGFAYWAGYSFGGWGLGYYR